MRWPASPEDHVGRRLPRRAHPRVHGAQPAQPRPGAIDVQQFHVWHDDWLEQGDWLETVEALKQEGKIRCFGVSINDHEPGTALELVRSGRVDTVQVIYNVFDQSPEDELFPLCVEHGVGVLARVPFDEGGLTGRIDAGDDVPRRRLPQRLLPRRPAARGRPSACAAIADDLGVAVEDVPEAGAALHPLRAGRLHRDPRHALDPQRRAQHRRGRRPRAPRRRRWRSSRGTAGCATGTGERGSPYCAAMRRLLPLALLLTSPCPPPPPPPRTPGWSSGCSTSPTRAGRTSSRPTRSTPSRSR